MRWKQLEFHNQWQLPAKPNVVWQYVADTHYFNESIGSPPLTFTEIPLKTGGSRLLAHTTKLGITVQWDEYPNDWVKNRWYRSVRDFHNGPLTYICVDVTLEPNQEGTCCKMDVEVHAANLPGWLIILYQIGWKWRHDYDRAIRQVIQALQDTHTPPFRLNISPLKARSKTRLSQLIAQLLQQGHPKNIVDHLNTLLTIEADINLIRLRPYALAKMWGTPPQQTLELFLSAVKVGLLNMQWDSICPLCWGDKQVVKSLDQVRKGVHCPTCNFDFEVNFSKHIELTFKPHPQIRPIHHHLYCSGGPMTTPHIVAHQTLKPKEVRVIEISLIAERYRIRTQRPDIVAWITVTEPSNATSNELQVTTDGARLDTTGSPSEGNITVTLTNQAKIPQRIFLERDTWYQHAVTAAEVTALQHFRDLFSDEVLRPGEEIGIQGMTILFSDLVGSTAMYNQIGDAPSYALVRQQFAFLQQIVRNNQGAIVKTIGDAIMGAFITPLKGLKAALEIQQKIHGFNQQYPQHPLKIKLGLHHGPCIAVTLNGRLDYFGTTVNLAARLKGQSWGGDVVISSSVKEDVGVTTLLKTASISLTPFQTTIKGFDEAFELYRLGITT